MVKKCSRRVKLDELCVSKQKMFDQKMLDKEMQDAIKEIAVLRQKEKLTSQKLDKTINRLFRQKEQQKDKQKKLEVLEEEGRGYSEQVKALAVKINEITQGRAAAELKQQVEKELLAIKKALEQATEKLAKDRHLAEEARKVHYSSRQEDAQIQKRLTQAQADLTKKLKEHSFSSDRQAEEALLTVSEKEKLQAAAEEFKKEKLFAQKTASHLQAKLRGRNLSEDDWQQLQQQLEKLKQDLELSSEQVHVLRDRLKKLEQNHTRWLELEQQRQGEEELTAKLQALTDLFRGNTFVEFMAEEQLINVAADASQRLGELTAYRYALETDSEGGFIIRDDANGGLRRPVYSLSGGETFLTSLALALALSGQIQLKGQYPLEFFFLDEGFGTLDNHLLEVVMNALERLQAEKMTIGIITHVPELKARLARSLTVIPAADGRGSKLQVETYID